MDADRSMGRLILPTVDYRDGAVRILDQTVLPHEERILELRTYGAVAEAIRTLAVRGAPAIGIAAAYGVLAALEEILRRGSTDDHRSFFDRIEGARPLPAVAVTAERIRNELERARSVLAETRPTAVNLFWALDRMRGAIGRGGDDTAVIAAAVAAEAFAIHNEELEIEFAIGRHGSPLIEDGMRVLTHCNAGGLATAGYGTALGVLYRAHEEGKRLTVYVDETRPLLQGARLTAWELGKRRIESVLLCDNAAPSLFASGRVDAAIVGADRIAANGDTANKVGTLGVAILCERFGVPFYVAAPVSTFDARTESGDGIPIEQRDRSEVTSCGGRRTAPGGVAVYNPAFDVTPAGLVTAIITERGLIQRPDRASIGRMMQWKDT